MKTIDHSTLRRLVDAGAPIGAEVVGEAGGWGVVINYGRASQILSVERGHPRTFRSFETLAGYLKDLGITDLRVHIAEFAPAANDRQPNDKRAEIARDRMKRAHEAAAHDKWFREQVQLSIDDPRPGIPHEVVKADMAKHKTRLRKAIEAKAAN